MGEREGDLVPVGIGEDAEVRRSHVDLALEHRVVPRQQRRLSAHKERLCVAGKPKLARHVVCRQQRPCSNLCLCRLLLCALFHRLCSCCVLCRDVTEQKLVSVCAS